MQQENLNTPNCIRTVSGLYVNVFDPKPEMFCIEDIAHALANIPRFGGHLPRFYSVAEHCLNGVGLLPNIKDQFAFLMHDCSEAYLLDLPRPIKMNMPEYQRTEHKLMEVLSKKFGFEYPLSESVKNTDQLMLEAEWYQLMLGTQYSSFLHLKIFEARDRFLSMYKYLLPLI